MTSYTQQKTFLTGRYIQTPLGKILALADEGALYFLQFMDECKAGERLGKYLKSRNTTFDLGESAILSSIEIELFQYFQGQLKIFTTPLICVGSLFQKRVWENLLEIPYGQTRSYAEVARKLDKPTAYRAVAQANAANAIAIVIPCHRVINTGGAYGGYASGMEKKIWLLRHEGYI